jgi:hypothetical protein
MVNAIEALSRSNVPFMPNTLVAGGGGSVGGVLEGLGALLMQKVGPGASAAPSAPVSPGISAAPAAPAPPPAKSSKA